MMPRNLDRRVEVMCPSSTPPYTSRSWTRIMMRNFEDNEQSWTLLSTAGPRVSGAPAQEPFNFQKYS